MQPTQSVRLEASHLKLFIAIFLQNETVFNEFRTKFTADHLDEPHYKIIMLAMRDLYEQKNELPVEAELRTQVESMFETDPDLGSDAVLDDIADFLNYAYTPESFGKTNPEGASSTKLTKFAYSACKRLLQQRHAEALQQDIESTDNLSLLPAILTRASEQAHALELLAHTTEVDLAFPGNWDTTRNYGVIRSTGIPFIDKLTNGGLMNTETLMLMAPYGTCKTTIGVMFLTSGAKQCYERSLMPDHDGRIGLTIFATYEAPKEEVQDRILMNAGNISRYSLEAMGKIGLNHLGSDPDKPLDYEKKRFKTQIADGVFVPERVRADQVIPWLNAHAVILDFSGADKRYPNAGCGGIEELIARINLEVRNRGGKEKVYINSIIIDYLGLMVDNDETLTVNNKRLDNHQLYGKAILGLNRLAKQMDTVVVMLHQLNGEANKLGSPTKAIDHTSAQGSKSVAANVTFSLVVGSLTLDDDRLGQIACTKFRRSKPVPPQVIKVDGEFNTVFTPDGYRILKGRIVDKDTAQSVGVSTVVPNSNFAPHPTASASTPVAPNAAAVQDETYGNNEDNEDNEDNEANGGLDEL